MRSTRKQCQAFLGLQYQAFACKPSATLRFMCRRVFSAMLIVATGFATLQAGKSEAQQREDPLPRVILKAGGSFENDLNAFRFSGDGKLLVRFRKASGGGFFYGGTETVSGFELWNIATGNLQLTISDLFEGFEISPDGKTFLGWSGKSVSIRDAETGDTVATLEHDVGNSIHEVHFLRDGKMLAAFSYDDGMGLVLGGHTRIKFWNTETWQEANTGIDTRQEFYWLPAITSDGQTLAAFSEGSDKSPKLRIWNIDTGREEPSPKISDTSQFIELAAGPDTKTLIVRQPLQSSKQDYWDLSGKRPKAGRDYLYPRISSYPEFGLSGTSESADPVSVELEGNKFVIRDWRTDQVTHEFLNPTSWQQPSVRWTGFPFHTGSHLAANRFLMLYSASRSGGEINLWDLKTKALKETIQTKNSIAEMALASDGKTLAVRTSIESAIYEAPSRRVVIWDLNTRKELFGFDHDNLVRAIAFSPDGKLLAIAESEHVHLREVATGKHLASLNSATPQVFRLTFSHDGQHLAVGTGEDIELWHVAGRRREWKTPVANIDCVVFSPDGKSLAAGSGRVTGFCRFSLINASNGVRIFSSENDESVNFIHFALDGKSLSLVRGDGNLSRFDLASGKETTIKRVGGGDVSSELWSNRIAMNNSTNTLAATRFTQTYNDREGEISLCDATTGETRAVLTAATGDITCVLMTPDGLTVVGGGEARKTGALEIVDLKTGKLAGKMTGVIFEAVSPDGELLVTKNLKTAGLVLWKTRGGVELAKIPDGSQAKFSPDGTVLGVARSGVIELWNVADFMKAE